MFRAAFENLRNRFGMTKVLVVSGIVLIFSMSLISSGISGAVQALNLGSAISSAESYLKQGDWLAARQVVQKMQAELPPSVQQPSLKALTIRIDALEDSQQSFDKAESFGAERKYYASIVEYSKVLATDTSRYEIAVERIKALEPLAKEDALQQSQVLASKKKFQDAISLIDQVLKVAGPDARLTEARSKYTESRAVQIQAQIAQDKKLRKAALSKMRKTVDSFESMTWYKDYSSPIYSNANAFYLTFGASGSTKYSLWLKVTYFDDDWLFVNQARVNVDGEIYSLSCSNWERDNNSEIWEWCDISLVDRGMIEAIIKSKKAVIRFDGDKYYDTRTITSSQKQALLNVLRAYDAF